MRCSRNAQLVFHLAYRLFQQHIGFFEPIEYRVQVCGEQPAHASLSVPWDLLVVAWRA
jgi:hypothetical protein